MEYALTADHHRVHAFDAEKGQAYYCPVCGNQVIPRQGEVNSWHFAHVTSCISYVLTQQDADAIEWHCKRLGFKQCRIVATTVNGEEFKENIDVSWIHMRTSLWEKT